MRYTKHLFSLNASVPPESFATAQGFVAPPLPTPSRMKAAKGFRSTAAATLARRAVPSMQIGYDATGHKVQNFGRIDSRMLESQRGMRALRRTAGTAKCVQNLASQAVFATEMSEKPIICNKQRSTKLGNSVRGSVVRGGSTAGSTWPRSFVRRIEKMSKKLWALRRLIGLY